MKKTINLGLLGIARKAGFIEAGEETVTSAISGKRARLVIIASDSGENLKRKMKNASARNGVFCLEIPVSKSELGLSVGRGETGIVAVTDIGIAASFAEKLEPMGGEYAAAAQELKNKAEKQKQRRKEAAAHRNNVKTGKRRMK